MILTADIGNSKTALAIFRDGEIVSRAKFPTDIILMPKRFKYNTRKSSAQTQSNRKTSRRNFRIGRAVGERNFSKSISPNL